MKWTLVTTIAIATAAGMFREVALPVWCERLGWTLVHSVWQLAAIGCLAGVILTLSRRASPNARYGLSVVALLAMAVAPCVTWGLINVDRPRREPPPLTASGIIEPAGPVETARIIAPPVLPRLAPFPSIEAPPTESAVVPTVSAIPATVPAVPAATADNDGDWSWLSLRAAISDWLRVIVAVWFAGLILAAARPLFGLWTQFQLRTVGVAQVSEEIQQRMRRLASAMKVAPSIAIAQSVLAHVPMVVGYLRPVILLPASAISGLTIGQLESVIAHELAHVRRHDWLVNALQIVIETVLFYHPAVWWISRRIRSERELCCDDLALTVIGDRVTYGRMLLALEELRHVPSPLLAATGGDLVQRIRRLLPAEAGAVEGPRSWAPGVVVLMLFAAAGSFAMLSAKPRLGAAANERPDAAVVIDAPADQNPEVVAPLSPMAEIADSQSPVASPPAVLPPQAQAVDAGTAKVSTVTKDLPDFGQALDECVFDIGSMDIIANGSFSPTFASCLHFDRWLRNLGYGDLAWDATAGQWLAFRGARLVTWNAEPAPDASPAAINAVRAKIAAEGTVVLAASKEESTRVAIHTAEGHIAIIRTGKRTRSGLTVDVARLTDAETIRREQANDGLENAQWGPSVEGLQGGIALRGATRGEVVELAIGEMLPVKIFVRNASTEAKDYSWQTSQEPVHAALPDGRIPLLPNWRPRLVDQSGQLAVVASPRQPHEAMQLKTVRLEPGQAVLIGAAALSLWPGVDVGFYVGMERQTPAAVQPGSYRLSTEVDTGLISSPRLRTGDLTVQVVEATGSRLDALRRLDRISRRIDPDGQGRVAWKDPTGAAIRPAMPAAPVETLTIAMQAFDVELGNPVADASARVKFFAWGEGMAETLIEYEVVSDARGYFSMHIPRKLLADYQVWGSHRWRPDFRVHLNHPQYCENFKSYSLDDLRNADLISGQGQYLKDAADGDADKLDDWRRVDLEPSRTVTGRLLGVTGQPLPGVPIYGNNVLGLLSLFGNHRTDSEGRFRIQAAARELMKIEFRTAEFGRRLVDANPGQTDLGDLRGSGGARVRGRVLDADGLPVKHVSVNTPAYPDRTTQPNFVYTTDESGWFTTDVLEAGRYEVIVGDVRRPGDDSVRIVGSPPDLYLPEPFSVVPGESPPQLTLRPAQSQRLTATLISTIPKPARDERPQVVDPVVWSIAKARIERERREAVSTGEAERTGAADPARAQPFRAEPLTGVLKLNLNSEDQLQLAQSLVPALGMVPAVTVIGTLNTKPWTRTPNLLELDGEATPAVYSCKVPAELTDIRIDMGGYPQHWRIGDGPLLFGTTHDLPRLNGDLRLTVYRYRPTTLRVTFVDATNQPIALKDDQLPQSITMSAAYEREAEVRQAGAAFESSQALMSRTVFENAVYLFVVPAEAISLTVNSAGTAAMRRLLLKDGETTTLQIKLGTPSVEWNETTRPTFPAKGEQP